MKLILETMDGVWCSIADVLVHVKTQHEHDELLNAALQRIMKAHKIMTQKKCEICKTEVKFSGHIGSARGTEADPEKIKVIVDLPAPENVSEVRTFLGMVNQLNKFTPHLADKSKLIRELLQKDATWCWEEDQQNAFNNVKEILLKSTALAKYDPNKEIKICVDASSYR